MKVWMNHNKMDEEKGPKNNIMNGFMIGGFPSKCQHSFFERTLNCGRNIEKLRHKEVGDYYAKKYIILLLWTTLGSLVPLPKGRKHISCKWVFKIRHGVDGEVKCYKVRLTVRGFTQTFGVNYNKNFAPITKFVSIRCIFSTSGHWRHGDSSNGRQNCWRLWCRWNIDIRKYVVDKCCK